MVTTLKETNVLLILADLGWLTTYLGGPEAPNHSDSVLPRILVPILSEQDKAGRGFYCAQHSKITICNSNY